jgi:hypothetical protein
VLWPINPLLGNDLKRNNENSAISKQKFCKYATVLELLLVRSTCVTMEVLLETVFSMDAFRGYMIQPTDFSSISAVQCSAVQYSEPSWLVRVSELENCCSSVLVRCFCGKLIAETRGLFGNSE